MTLIPKTPPPDGGAPIRNLDTWRTDPAMWKSYVEDLIYAAATGPASYTHEIERRRPKWMPMTPAEISKANANGEAMGAELRAMFPEVQGIVRLARAATGEDEPDDRSRRQRWSVTIARCAAWLPKPVDLSPRRPGPTPEQRMADADALVAGL